MPGIMEIMQMCRLCLVKDQVNISIFDEKEDLRQIFLKITTCLPVKVEKDDKLPKKICDGCSYKLELLYQFVNTSVNAEKQLLTWLGETKKSSKSQEHPSVEAVVLKQEIVEPPEVMIVDTAQSSQNYVLQEENLPYESFEYEPSVDVSAAAALAEVDEHEMPSKRPRLAPSATVVSQGGEESDDDNGVEERIAKIENESEPDEDSVDAQQPQFISVASTSVSDQPGPSGVQKPVDPTSPTPEDLYDRYKRVFKLKSCVVLLGDLKTMDLTNYKFVKPRLHPPRPYKRTYKHAQLDIHEYAHKNVDGEATSCWICAEQFGSSSMLSNHITTHSPFTCHVCKMTYCTLNALRKHKKQVHDVELNGLEEARRRLKSLRASVSNDHCYQLQSSPVFQTYVCRLCKMSFSDLTLYGDHVVKDHMEEPQTQLRCDTCGQLFMDSKAYNKHLKAHKRTRHICGECQRSFLSCKTLCRHMMAVHKSVDKFQLNPAKCCAKYPEVLLEVVDSEGDAVASVTYACPICWSMSTTFGMMKKHMLVHIPRNGKEDVEKPNRLQETNSELTTICSACSVKFPDEHQLRVHLERSKMQKCTQCDFSTCSVSILNAHYQKEHFNELYKCSYCNYEGNVINEFEVHLQWHEKNKGLRNFIKPCCNVPVGCGVCKLAFSSSSVLKIHLQQAHRFSPSEYF